MATKIPYDQGSGLIRIVRSDESFDESYCADIELNIVLETTEIDVFEIKSDDYTILRVDQTLIDSGVFSDYSTVQQAYDDVFDVLEAMLAGIGGGGSGDVTGPSSSVDGNIVLFDGATGKLIQDSGIGIADLINDIFYGALQVDAATTAALAGSPTYANGVAGVGATLTKGSNGAFPSQDGVTSTVNMRVLVKNQVTQTQNGVYYLSTLGDAGTPWVLTRATDSDLNTELDAQVVIVGAGTTNARRVYNQTTALPVIGTSNIIYAQTAAAAGIGAPLSRTVAQMQALVAASGLTPGRAYIISNVQSADCTCSAMFIAISTTKITKTGWGTFDNTAMGSAVDVTLEYDLATDLISSIYVPATNVRVNMLVNCVTLVTFWPFDSATIANGTANDPTAVPDTDAICYNFVFEAQSSPNLGAGTTFSGRIGFAAGVTLSGTALLTSADIGDNSVIAMAGTQSFSGGTQIGSNKTVDLTGLVSNFSIATPVVYVGDYSNIVIGDDNLATPGTLDMASNSGLIDFEKFKMAGTILVKGDGTQKLNEYANFPTDHKWSVVPDIISAFDVLIASFPGGSTNIYLETNTYITLVGSALPVDRATFQVDEQDPTMIIKVGGANYTR